MDDMLNGKQSRDHLQQIINEVQEDRLARNIKKSNKKESSILRNLINNIKSITS
jgi:hypothetical protein